MEKKIIMFISIFFITLAVITFFTTKNLSNSPPDIELEECHNLAYNGEGKTNIVFFSPEETAKRYQEKFYSTSPFNENKQEFNFYYIDYKPECELYKGIAILCYSKELIKKAASCPNDIIVAIEEKPANIRSSAYMNVISLNENSNLNVFTHEFGHVFANLADEYVPAKIPKGSKNCQNSCDKFNQENCFSGCSEDGLKRSIQSGIMRTLSSGVFGEFNEEIIKSKIKKNSLITGNVIYNSQDCKNSQYYLIEGEIIGSSINIKEKSIENGCIGNNGAGPYTYSFILENNEKIQTEEFNPEIIFTDLVSGEEISEGPENYEGSFLLRIPILEGANLLEIKDETKITQINLKDIGARPCEI